MAEENQEQEQLPAIQDLAPILNPEERDEFMKYLAGETAQPPAIINKVMTSIANKLTMVAGCDMVNSVKRESTLDAFMAAAEGRLFNVETIQDMPLEQVQDLYKQASKRKDTLAESRRKFLAQNRDAMSIQGSAQEKLLTQIMAMSPEQIDKLKEAVAKIAAETVDTPEQTSPEAVEEQLQ